MKRARNLVWLALPLAISLLPGCASVSLSRETRQRLHEELMDRKYFVITAPKIDGVTATTEKGGFKLTFQGELDKTWPWSSASPITSDGFMLTAKHSIKPALTDSRSKPWVIEFNRGHPRALAAAVVWTGTNSDLALLKVKAETCGFFEWSHPHGKLKRGTVAVQGGLKSHMASGKLRSETLLDKPELESVVIPHSLRSRHGDSGAPLIDEEGRLIGIITRRIYFEFGSERDVLGGGEALRPNVEMINHLIEQYRHGGGR